MNIFYKKAIAFWFVLLVLAIVNAIVRETTYKPLLFPYIGMWAHQISSVTGILLFFGGIYLFLRRMKDSYTKNDLVKVGLMWIVMTFLFETFMNVFVRKLSFEQVLQTYYVWQGETWIFVLLSLLVSPVLIYYLLGKSRQD